MSAEGEAGIALTPTCGHPSPACGRGGRVSGLEHGQVALGSGRGLFAAGVLGYLIGSFPTADLVSKYATRRSGGDGVDLRAAGRDRPHPDLRSPLSRVRERGRGRGDGGVDLRAAGSGNPGAVNAATVLGRKWGLLVRTS